MTFKTQYILTVKYCIPYLRALDSGVFSTSSNTDGFSPLTIFVKSYISDVQLGSE